MELEEARRFALSLPEPHFDRTSFRVVGIAAAREEGRPRWQKGPHSPSWAPVRMGVGSTCRPGYLRPPASRGAGAGCTPGRCCPAECPG